MFKKALFVTFVSTLTILSVEKSYSNEGQQFADSKSQSCVKYATIQCKPFEKSPIHAQCIDQKYNECMSK
ncbi:hypothetical protein CN884_01070 [Ochrobactrum sp. 30A/1000/2015]|nr:hypothetical protein A7J42_03400 [Brucella intermedia]PJT27032.1 hypothetical protein CN884_01070 [Ochrobactrum sp. 30A/1000/2015]PJT38452.1 hypothetical protein CN883_11685 [Ochrobactrum sp. 27A/999/2015]PJT44471.1 hypothetical protein CN882_01070 [Ochrobactrum sp. 23A/997/2015]RQP20336.1 MAG: hypothetical protein EAS49_04320 [Brucella intermedia]